MKKKISDKDTRAFAAESKLEKEKNEKIISDQMDLVLRGCHFLFDAPNKNSVPRQRFQFENGKKLEQIVNPIPSAPGLPPVLRFCICD